MSQPFQTEDSDLDEALASAYVSLKTAGVGSESYQQILDQIVKLDKLKNNQKKLNLELYVIDNKIILDEGVVEYEREQNSRPFYMRVDPNVALTVLGNLIIGYGVIKYEQTGVISSKVLSFMKKM